MRASVRQRTTRQLFDPTESAATAGYVQFGGISPSAESGLPFDFG